MADDERAVVSRLRSAKIDGRTENVRYRQTQLQYLHRELAANQDDIRGALRKDSGFSDAETDVEFANAMNVLRELYDALDFDKSLKDEYSVTRHSDYVQRRVGVGLVYIEPGTAFPFFSTIAPLCAAIAAGNCILLHIDNDLRYLPGLLRKVLTKALDPDTFVFGNNKVNNESFLTESVQVYQDAEVTLPPQVKVLRSRMSARTVAVVDRTADLESAARSLTEARVAFNGRSSYAPDVVLVNEFVMKAFIEACARHVLQYSTKCSSASTTGKRSLEGIMQMLDAEPSATVAAMASNGCVASLSSRKAQILRMKLHKPVLLVTPISSLDDAIDYHNSSADKGATEHANAPYLASYIFAKPESAKYLAQFIRAEAVFVNLIPADLLVGPAAPFFPSQPLSIKHRYTTEMFSTASPQFVKEPTSSRSLSQALFSPASKDGSKNIVDTTDQLVKKATAPLKPSGQPLQAREVGFFEQGIMIGLGLAATPILLGLTSGIYFGGKYLWMRFR